MNPLADQLSRRLSKAQVISGFESERWAMCGRVPQAVVFPESEEQVATILALASEEGWHCVPVGRGSWLQGGQPPESVDVLLSAERMNQISAYEPADLFIEAQAGVPLDVMERCTSERGQRLVLDPPGGSQGTLGGTLAVGTAGPLESGFGPPRDQLLVATLVTGDGRVLNLGGRVVKNVAGFDLLKLLVGSWGTLGMITSATIRVHPVAAIDRTLLFRASEPEASAALACRLAQTPIPLAAVELLVPGDGESGGGSSSPLIAVRILESESAAVEAERIVSERAGTVPVQRLDGAADKLGTHGVTRRLGRDHDDVEIGARLDLAVVDVEAVSEGDSGALFQVRFDILLVDDLLVLVRRENHDDIGGLARFGDAGHLETGAFGLGSRRRALAQTDGHVDPGLFQVVGVSVAL